METMSNKISNGRLYGPSYSIYKFSYVGYLREHKKTTHSINEDKRLTNHKIRQILKNDVRNTLQTL